MSERMILIRVTVVQPPVGVRFCLQHGKAHLVGGAISKGDDLPFTFEVRARPEANGGARLLGPFVQGPPTARFVYICVGRYAGQSESPWQRRIKVPLSGIRWEMIESLATGHLASAFEGTMADGSPACATVKLTQSWKVCAS